MVQIWEYRKIARENLRGRWGSAVGAGLAAGILGASTGITVSGGPAAGSGSANYEETQEAMLQFMQSDFYIAVQPWLRTIGITLLAWVLIMFIAGGAMTLGYARFNLKLADDEDVRFSDIFSQIGRLWEGFCMQFFQVMMVFFWSLLFWFPGLVACYRYAMTPYILAEDYEISVMEAISRSKRMMRGHKWELFCLNLSFMGWIILGALTLGIGFLWIGPYMEAAKAVFYREVSQQKYSRAAVKAKGEEARYDEISSGQI